MFHFAANGDEKSSPCYKWTATEHTSLHLLVKTTKYAGLFEFLGKKKPFDLHDLFFKFIRTSPWTVQPLTFWQTAAEHLEHNTFTSMNSLLDFITADTLSTVLGENRQIPRFCLFPFVMLHSTEKWSGNSHSSPPHSSALRRFMVLLVVVVSSLSLSLMISQQTF